MMTWENLGKALTTAAFAGVGLAALAGEQLCKAGKVLAEKGEIYVAQGKKYGEELQQKLQEDARRRQDERFDQQVSALDAEQRDALRRRLAELDELEREAREAAAQADEKVSRFLEKQGGRIVKTIVVKNKLVNLIAK